jgi:hypothetical protein
MKWHQFPCVWSEVTWVVNKPTTRWERPTPAPPPPGVGKARFGNHWARWVHTASPKSILSFVLVLSTRAFLGRLIGPSLEDFWLQFCINFSFPLPMLCCSYFASFITQIMVWVMTLLVTSLSPVILLLRVSFVRIFYSPVCSPAPSVYVLLSDSHTCAVVIVILSIVWVSKDKVRISNWIY